ncbi:hypothetical protein ACFL0Y_01195 [Patescibacteria group bacterium]
MKQLLGLFFGFLLAFSLFLWGPTTPAKAQEEIFSFEKAFQDYLYVYNQYLQSHNQYEAAKNSYYTYKTLASKADAMQKTLTMLQVRDDVVRTYLTTIRLRLADSTGISTYDQSLLYIKLDTEVGWYIQHRDEVTSAGTLKDLLKTSKKAETRFRDSEILAYEALIVILSGKVEAARNLIEQELDQIELKINEIRLKGDKEITSVERWLLEAENKIDRSREKQEQATITIQKLKPKFQKKRGVFNEARTSIHESLIYLKEANDYLKELIAEVKSAD